MQTDKIRPPTCFFLQSVIQVYQKWIRCHPWITITVCSHWISVQQQVDMHSTTTIVQYLLLHTTSVWFYSYYVHFISTFIDLSIVLVWLCWKCLLFVSVLCLLLSSWRSLRLARPSSTTMVSDNVISFSPSLNQESHTFFMFDMICRWICCKKYGEVHC